METNKEKRFLRTATTMIEILMLSVDGVIMFIFDNICEKDVLSNTVSDFDEIVRDKLVLGRCPKRGEFGTGDNDKITLVITREPHPYLFTVNVDFFVCRLPGMYDTLYSKSIESEPYQNILDLLLIMLREGLVPYHS